MSEHDNDDRASFEAAMRETRAWNGSYFERAGDDYVSTVVSLAWHGWRLGREAQRAEIADLKARLERAEELRLRDLRALGGECERLVLRAEKAERERDEARQTIGALEKSAAKYEAWVDENMRMI